MQPGAPFAVALINQPVVLDLQARGQVAGAEHSHRDRQILPMAARARRNVLGAVVGAVRARRAVPCPLDRLHRFAADAQGPERSAEVLLGNAIRQADIDITQKRDQYIHSLKINTLKSTIIVSVIQSDDDNT